MPTYDYACKACGHRFEEFQSISSDPLKKCPECRKNKPERLIGTGAGVIFKGSGFYETDYRSDSYKKAAEAETQSQSGDKKSGDKDGKKSGAADAKKSSGASKSSGGATKADSSKPQK